MVLKYNQNIINRFLKPKYCGRLSGDNVYLGESGSVLCGDILKLFLFIDNKTYIIKKARFLVFGCTSAFAASDLLCEILINKSIFDCCKIKNEHLSEMLKLPRIKNHCSVLAEEALYNTILNFTQKNNLDINKVYLQEDKINYSEYKETSIIEQKEKKYNISLTLDKRDVTFTTHAFETLKVFFKNKSNYFLYIYVKKHGCGRIYAYKILEKYSADFFYIDYHDFCIGYIFSDYEYIKNLVIDYDNKDIKSYLVFKKENIDTCFCGFTFS
ncbi:Iron-sulfur cluster assembly scaffold protein IscU [bacterium AB1]|nr:Iron-sulfur cluster assembly scaffold protein IscU [bacterium AB1]